MDEPRAQHDSVRCGQADLMELGVVARCHRRRSFLLMPERTPLEFEAAFANHDSGECSQEEIDAAQEQHAFEQSAHDVVYDSRHGKFDI
jgi:hypothetical protein